MRIIKILIIFQICFLLKIKTVSFTLEKKDSEMCFLLKGNIIGSLLILDYNIVGKNNNISFKIIDQKEFSTLHKQKDHKEDSENIYLNINKKHNYLLYWKNLDNIKKEIIFYYKEKNYMTIFDKDDVERHMGILNNYKEMLKEINNNIKIQFFTEEYYLESFNVQSKYLKICFYFKIFFLGFVIFIQIYYFLKYFDYFFKMNYQI